MQSNQTQVIYVDLLRCGETLLFPFLVQGRQAQSLGQIGTAKQVYWAESLVHRRSTTHDAKIRVRSKEVKMLSSRADHDLEREKYRFLRFLVSFVAQLSLGTCTLCSSVGWNVRR